MFVIKILAITFVAVVVTMGGCSMHGHAYEADNLAAEAKIKALEVEASKADAQVRTEKIKAMADMVNNGANPVAVRCIVLIGCGSFDPSARKQMEATIAERSNAQLANRRRRLAIDVKDVDVRLCVLCRLLEPLYTFEGLPGAMDETEEYDRRGHDETWSDMVRLQERGIYPAAFSRISVPVLMVHGDWDPHPGLMTLRTLQTYMPQIEYVELRECGHYPWREKAGRGPLFETLRDWLGQYMT